MALGMETIYQSTFEHRDERCQSLWHLSDTTGKEIGGEATALPSALNLLHCFGAGSPFPSYIRIV